MRCPCTTRSSGPGIVPLYASPEKCKPARGENRRGAKRSVTSTTSLANARCVTRGSKATASVPMAARRKSRRLIVGTHAGVMASLYPQGRLFDRFVAGGISRNNVELVRVPPRERRKFEHSHVKMVDAGRHLRAVDRKGGRADFDRRNVAACHNCPLEPRTGAKRQRGKPHANDPGRGVWRYDGSGRQRLRRLARNAEVWRNRKRFGRTCIHTTKRPDHQC